MGSNHQVIRETKTWILRCYACFHTTPRMEKKFCPKCGNKTLKRVSVTVDSEGKQQVFKSCPSYVFLTQKPGRSTSAQGDSWQARARSSPCQLQRYLMSIISPLHPSQTWCPLIMNNLQLMYSFQHDPGVNIKPYQLDCCPQVVLFLWIPACQRGQSWIFVLNHWECHQQMGFSSPLGHD